MRHRWMAFVPFDVTVEDGLRIVGVIPSRPGPVVDRARDDPPAPDDPRPFLGSHNLHQQLVTVGCYACEQPLTAETAKTDCPGDPETGQSAEELWAARGYEPGAMAAATEFRGVGRNEPCPCGSGAKYKQCHGA